MRPGGDCAGTYLASQNHQAFCPSLSLHDEALKVPAALASVLVCLHGRLEVRELDLSGNHIRSTSAEGVGALLGSLSCLEVVDLSNNALGQAGVDAALQAVLRHPRLRRLSLATNFLDGKVLKDSVVSE